MPIMPEDADTRIILYRDEDEEICATFELKFDEVHEGWMIFRYDEASDVSDLYSEFVGEEWQGALDVLRDMEGMESEIFILEIEDEQEEFDSWA